MLRGIYESLNPVAEEVAMRRRRWLLGLLALLCLTAVFAACEKQKPEFEVSFMNGTEKVYSATVEEGAALPTPENDPVRTETDEYVYTFKGWSLTEGGEIVDLASVTAVTEDMTFYAVFDEIPKYTVTFVDGVTQKTIAEQKVVLGGSATAPEIPVHEGYKFDRWDKDFSAISGRTTVTALYKKFSYTLTYEVLGTLQEKTVEFGGDFALEAPDVEGLTFVDWYIDADGKPERLTDKYPSGMPASDVSVYALFEIDWNGIGLNTQNAVYGGKASVTLPGYNDFTFTCKWTDGSYGEEYTYAAAGEQTVGVQVTAKYKDYITEQKSFEAEVNVAKAELSVTVTVNNAESGSLTYGTAPEVSFAADGWVNAQDEAALKGKFAAEFYFDHGTPELVAGDRLEVGGYQVYAVLGGQENYVLSVTPAQLNVKQKELTLRVEVKNMTYGATAEPVVVSDDFAYGEDVSDLTAGTVTIYNGGQAVSGVLPAGTYTASASGYKSVNYSIKYAAATEFTVEKAFLSVTVNAKPSYVYADEIVPALGYSGFVNGDTAESVFGDTPYEFVYTKVGESEPTEGILPVGSYTVSVDGLEADNYSVQLTEGSFSVARREITLTASATLSGAWSKSDFAPTNLPDEFAFAGTLSLTEGAKDEPYTLQGVLDDVAPFVWSEPYKITLDGADVTQNFAINYNVSVKIDNTDFSIAPIEPFSADYTGKAIALGHGITVNDAPEDLKIEYRLADGEYSESLPTAVNAGTYTVYFKLSAKYYADYPGEYIAEITQAQNKITEKSPFEKYTYTGQPQTIDFAEHLQADFGEVVLKAGQNNTFTDAGTYQFVVCVEGTENYGYCEYPVTVTIEKADYTQAPKNPLVNEKQEALLGINKTLADVELKEGFTWAEPSAAYAEGANTFAAVYCADEKNYNPYSLKIGFTARKETITLSVDNGKLAANLESQGASLNVAEFDLFGALTAVGEDGEAFSAVALSELCTAAFDGGESTISVGSTYVVVFNIKTNAYYKAVFNTNDSSVYAPFKLCSVKVGEEFYTIEDALAAAESGTVIVAADTAFASAETVAKLGNLYTQEGGHYTVKENVTLLVPFDETYSTDTKEVITGDVSPVTAKGYVKLAVASGVKLTVFGDLTVNAKRNSHSNQTSVVYGSTYGEMEVCENAYIYLENGSCFESIGFSYGAGEIVVKEGAYVYEPFNLVGWKGATISMKVMNTVFPLNQYSMSSLEVKTTFQYGSLYYTKATANVTLAGVQHIDVLFGSKDSNSFIQLMDEESYFCKSVNASNGKIRFDFYGNVQINNMSVSLSGVTLDTANKQIPIPGNFELSIYGTTTIPNGVQAKFLPGAQLNVESGANLVIKSGGAVYAYGGNVTEESYSNDLTKWQDGNNGLSYPHSYMTSAYRIKPVLGYNATTHAVLLLNGTLKIESGAVLAAEISGEKDGALLELDSGALLEKAGLQEDYTKYEGPMGIFTKEAYFTVDFGCCLNESDITLEPAKSYAYNGGAWSIVA